MSVEKAAKVSVNGIDLAYDAIGDGERDLIFLHGYSIQSTGIVYKEIFSHLSDYFRIIALDLRGHGKNAAYSDDWTFAKVADDISEVALKLNLKNPVHAGHSFGGFMGMMTELRNPNTFSALALLAPSAACGGSATPEEVRVTITEQGKNNSVMRELYKQMYVHSVDDAALQPLVKAVEVMDSKVHRAYFYKEYPENIITDKLREITTPTLMIIGAHDEVVATEEQHKTVQGLPNFKEVVFSDEGHMLPLEAPARTAREIINFIKYDILC